MSKDKKISLEEVEHIAELARIKLTKEEKEEFSDELSDILGYIEQLQEVNTDGVEPVSQVTGLVNVLKEDIVKNCDEDSKKKIVENFPEEKDGYVKVRQVM
ncbi:MAG: Asp-tRNA(Asn)/Glu-tRNA(Gln) amidotransferase subunit GatC [Patescibacteria group bacterium]|nr:Asp-tRNA(Asn)/Glu-tRNA(Gln) amidotransferase subunit GatC [Patescibacteria group bacterium]